MVASPNEPLSPQPATPLPGPLDPIVAEILAEAAAMPRLDPETTPIAQQRRAVEIGALAWTQPPFPVAEVVDHEVPTPYGAMKARLYRPEGAASDAAMLFAHGGGWTFGSLDTHDDIGRRLAAIARLPLLAIDYRLAPEHPFPAPVEDAAAGLAFLEHGGIGAPIAPQRLVVSGDSAGAQTVLALLVARRDAGLPAIGAGLLFYGCLAPDFDTESHRRFGGGDFGLTTDQMRWYWSNHLGGRLDDPRGGAPLRADLHGLPPLFLDAASHDCLRDDTLRLADRLAAAGVPHRLHRSEGVVHGYLRFLKRLPAATATLEAAAAFVSETLGAS